MTRYEVWGSKEMPTDEDINRQFSGRPESMFEEEGYEELKSFWKELTAVSDPINYGMITRAVEDDLAETVAIYFPGDRQEVYEIDWDERKVNISMTNEEHHQHGFQSFTSNYDYLNDWIQDIIELEDDLTWREL